MLPTALKVQALKNIFQVCSVGSKPASGFILLSRLRKDGGRKTHPRGNENWKRDLGSVSFTSPRQLSDFSCFSIVSPEKQVQKISTWAPCKFQRRSHQALNEVSDCHPSPGKEKGLSGNVLSLTYCS